MSEAIPLGGSASSLETPSESAQDSPPEIASEGGTSPMHMAFMNMSNSILGAGIIGQAYAVRNCGIVAGIVVFILITFLVDWTIRLVVINCKLSGTKTFQGTADRCFGRLGKLVILAAQGVFALGGSIAFCIIIGDTVPHVLQSFVPASAPEFVDFLVSRRSVVVLLTCFVSYPLSLSGNIASLAMLSFFALLNMAAIILIVVIRCVAISRSNGLDYHWNSLFTGFFVSLLIFQGASVISFAMVCHHNTSFIYDLLKKPTLDRFTRLTHWSCGILMVCCVLIGVTGASVFKDQTKGNLLNNFLQDDWIINIARLCFGLNMLTTFPLEIFVVRQVLFDLIDFGGSDYITIADPDLHEHRQVKRSFFVTTALVFGTMFVSLLTCNLGATLELVGLVLALIMAFIFPCLCNLKLTNYKLKSFKENLPSYLTILLGVAILVISLAQTIYQALTNLHEGTC